MNAMSYCVSVFRHGWYGRRPNVEIPEKMESACVEVSSCLEGSIEVWKTIPEYRHRQEAYCTTVPHADRPMALGRDHGRHEQQQSQQSSEEPE
jgi:hypothetical protein